jgi:4-amino-4-deoxy-L-arabinose transferase-like glycosyltransferase
MATDDRPQGQQANMVWNRTWLLLVGVFLAFNLLLFNDDISLWDDDEAAYAGFVQQMLTSGDWVNPRHQWGSIHRKPPFHFWTLAISFSIFGVSEFALRLPSVLAVWLTCASLWWFGRRLFGEDRAAWAATILASSLVVPLFGKVALTDATLLLFQTTAALGLLNYIHEPSFRWNLLLWTSVALGVLVKGPPVLVLIVGLWAWLLVFHPQRRNLIGTHPWLFLLLALLPLGAWMYLSWVRDEGRLLAFLYDWYVMKRLGGHVLDQTGPPGYHLAVLLISFAAWLPFLSMAIAERIHTWRHTWSPHQIALAGWMVFGWLFFELMSSKSPSYALAAQPAWALAIAPQLCRRVPLFPRVFKAAILLQAVVWLGMVGALSGFGYWLVGAQSLWSVGILIVVAATTGAYMVRHLWQSHRLGGIYTTVFAMSVFTTLILVVAWAVEPSPIKNIKPMVETAYQWAGSKTIPVYYTELHAKQRQKSLPVYLSRRFQSHQALKPDATLARYLGPAPALFIIGTRTERFFNALKLRQVDIPHQRLLRIEWRSTDDRLRSHPFWLLRNFD